MSVRKGQFREELGETQVPLSPFLAVWCRRLSPPGTVARFSFSLTLFHKTCPKIYPKVFCDAFGTLLLMSAFFCCLQKEIC